MNSEQAIWAKQWIKDHCDLTSFQKGYTYLFEIIYQNNTVIVNYTFEGLVLLAITDESGLELPYQDVVNCARNMGFFMVTPRITGPYSEVRWYCGGIDDNTQESTPPNHPVLISGALPVSKRQEGWVVKFNDGSRQKIVYSWRKKALKITRLVHPQIVWLLVKHDKFREILGKLPSHFRVEVCRMIQAIGRKFLETVRFIEEYLTELNVKLQVSTQHRCELDEKLWGYSFFPSASDESTDLENDKSTETCEQTVKLSLDEEVTPVTDLCGKWCFYGLSPPGSDESTDSENDAGQETLARQTEKLRLDEDDTSGMATNEYEVIPSDMTTSKYGSDINDMKTSKNDDNTSDITTSKYEGDTSGMTTSKYEGDTSNITTSKYEDDTSCMKTRKDAVEHVKNSDTNKTSDFVRLARKLKPYWRVISKKPKLRKPRYKTYETQEKI